MKLVRCQKPTATLKESVDGGMTFGRWRVTAFYDTTGGYYERAARVTEGRTEVRWFRLEGEDLDAE